MKSIIHKFYTNFKIPIAIVKKREKLLCASEKRKLKIKKLKNEMYERERKLKLIIDKEIKQTQNKRRFMI